MDGLQGQQVYVYAMMEVVDEQVYKEAECRRVCHFHLKTEVQV